MTRKNFNKTITCITKGVCVVTVGLISYWLVYKTGQVTGFKIGWRSCNEACGKLVNDELTKLIKDGTYPDLQIRDDGIVDLLYKCGLRFIEE